MNVKALNLYLKVVKVRAIVIFTESLFQVSDIVIKCSFIGHGICAPTDLFIFCTHNSTGRVSFFTEPWKAPALIHIPLFMKKYFPFRNLDVQSQSPNFSTVWILLFTLKPKNVFKPWAELFRWMIVLKMILLIIVIHCYPLLLSELKHGCSAIVIFKSLYHGWYNKNIFHLWSFQE